MSRVVFRDERCKGCLYCAQACPKNIIHQADRFNEQGYKVAELVKGQEAECIGCGICGEVCPDYVITVWKDKKKKKEGGK